MEERERQAERNADKDLIEYYKLGWSDCSEATQKKMFEDKLLQRAYEIGWLDFIVGDEVSSVDLQSEKDILKTIRLIKNER